MYAKDRGYCVASRCYSMAVATFCGSVVPVCTLVPIGFVIFYLCFVFVPAHEAMYITWGKVPALNFRITNLWFVASVVAVLLVCTVLLSFQE